MKKIIALTTAIILALTATVQAAEFETWYVGAESGLNLRENPTIDSNVMTVYPKSTELTVIGIDTTGEWWEVWDGSRQGWLKGDYMVDSPDKTTAPKIGECIGTFTITGYTSAPEENGGYSVDCFGEPLEPQIGSIVAVDPNVIPLGINLYIEGIGYRTTHDTGVYGNVIDVLTANRDESDIVTGKRKVYLVE